ncbi:18287_t:CDS:2 [Acaulospora morrowiae]|uniref:18287_t:CDS:1 n=1 Tax=Acaulospora morrowiae TaxID=94023 RepID=A0A9N9CE95_9GLOM|nr:18287_t:CDS:2 [Acaulospora morrowiae]
MDDYRSEYDGQTYDSYRETDGSTEGGRFPYAKQVCTHCHNEKRKCEGYEEGGHCLRCIDKNRDCQLFQRRQRGPKRTNLDILSEDLPGVDIPIKVSLSINIPQGDLPGVNVPMKASSGVNTLQEDSPDVDVLMKASPGINIPQEYSVEMDISMKASSNTNNPREYLPDVDIPNIPPEASSSVNIPTKASSVLEGMQIDEIDGRNTRYFNPTNSISSRVYDNLVKESLETSNNVLSTEYPFPDTDSSESVSKNASSEDPPNIKNLDIDKEKKSKTENSPLPNKIPNKTQKDVSGIYPPLKNGLHLRRDTKYFYPMSYREFVLPIRDFEDRTYVETDISLCSKEFLYPDELDMEIKTWKSLGHSDDDIAHMKESWYRKKSLLIKNTRV